MGKTKNQAKGLPPQKQAKTAQKSPGAPAAAKAHTPQAQGKVEPGTFDVPGGKIIINDKGISHYEGTPYVPTVLRKRYLAWADDHDARGKVKERIGR